MDWSSWGDVKDGQGQKPGQAEFDLKLLFQDQRWRRGGLLGMCNKDTLNVDFNPENDRSSSAGRGHHSLNASFSFGDGRDARGSFGGRAAKSNEHQVFHRNHINNVSQIDALSASAKSFHYGSGNQYAKHYVYSNTGAGGLSNMMMGETAPNLKRRKRDQESDGVDVAALFPTTFGRGNNGNNDSSFLTREPSAENLWNQRTAAVPIDDARSEMYRTPDLQARYNNNGGGGGGPMNRANSTGKRHGGGYQGGFNGLSAASSSAESDYGHGPSNIRRTHSRENIGTHPNTAYNYSRTRPPRQPIVMNNAVVVHGKSGASQQFDARVAAPVGAVGDRSLPARMVPQSVVVPIDMEEVRSRQRAPQVFHLVWYV